MAKRLLKDWTTSEKMDKVSLEAEVFFTRLIMKADDYGTYYANPKLLKAALFPLKEVSFNEIGAWVHECIEAGLIFLYEADEKEFIRIVNFDQRLRNKRNAFPHPENNSQQPAANRSELMPEREEKKEVEEEVEVESEDAHVEFVDKNVPRELKIVLPDKNKIAEEIFNDELFVDDLRRNHPKKDIPRAWDECWLYHSQKPSPPTLSWQWRQKLSTWLINTKDERTSKKTTRADATNARREAFAAKHGTSPGG